MSGVQDHETVSIYPLDDQQREALLTNASECVLNWSTRDGWPVGVVHAFYWGDGRVWITAGEHRHRIAAIKRDPRVSVVVSGAAAPAGKAPGGAITIKGRCVIHSDEETKAWFYPALANKVAGGNPEAAAAFAKRLDSPLRVILEVIPEKWITFDGAKFAMDSAGVLPEDQRGQPLSSDADRLPKLMKERGLS
ncbi:MAG: pyridoxamine 5'-phosphate oxidase family protein [Dehalococcoidia bacterium]